MEVHHHPDLHHEKKPWKEYILEFVMIFLAVTMGFFAESLREHITDKEKESKYMRSMIQDLMKDTVATNWQISLTSEYMHGLDSLFQCLHSKVLTDSVQRRLYYLNIKYSRIIGMQFSDATNVQLMNAGGMRLIEDQKVSNMIALYWREVEVEKLIAEIYNGKVNNLIEESYKIFDRVYIQNFTITYQAVIIKISPDARLMIQDKNQLIAYANRVVELRNSLKNWVSMALKRQKSLEKNLINSIKENYHF